MGSQRTLLKPLQRNDPDRIGSYTLLGRLGAGAMGRVYLGKSPAGRLVAVKTIKLEYAEEPDFRARFAHEVTAAGKVSGVFTAAVVEADPDADVPWLATAYVPAPSLDQLVQACGPLPVSAVRWLAAGCAEALGSIHNAGLVHRDLKPSNVLVAADGPRVIDFGVARAVDQLHMSTAHGSVGTPAYMAPEQARDNRRATMASDVFSLGSTLLYAATGHAPYQGETVLDILVQLATEAPDLSALPRELGDVVIGCLERDPRQRPTPAALLAGLAPYVELAGGHDLGPSCLPPSALALIEEHRARPEAAGRATEPAAADATVGSQPGLVEPPRRPPQPVGLIGRLRRPAGRRPGTGPGAWARPRPPLGGRILTVVVSVAAVVGLVIFGAVLNRWIGRDPSAPASSQQGGNSQPTGPALPGGRIGGRPPEPAVPSGGVNDRPGGQPQLVLNQDSGDIYTGYVLHGRGWPAATEITIEMSGRKSANHPVTDRAGTFNYTIDQGHEFFPGPIPLGTYTATASAGGRTTRVTFTVHD
ncbi:MAG: hypothetical protein V7637_528 [Mycobacteriales bacterium]